MTGANMGERRAFRVIGRVQGVGFRWWTRREAERLSVGGTVGNREDGSVEVHLIGSQERVEAMRQRLGEGPPFAKVERVDEVPAADNLIAGDFRVVR